MKLRKKIFSSIFLALLVFLLIFPSYSAEALFSGGISPGPGLPTPAEVIKKIMADLGMDKGEVMNAADTFNSTRTKKNAPQVKLEFMPPNPTAGEEVTATAAPVYFGNDPALSYYTWYVKHNDGTGEGTDAQGRKTKAGNTDWNDDDKIDIEDYKIEAARIQASGDFDWKNASYDADRDKDGYRAPFGGEDQRGKLVHCFVHSFTSGNEYEILDGNGNPKCEHLFPKAYYIDGNGAIQIRQDVNGNDQLVGYKEENANFNFREENFWHTDPNNNDTVGTSRADEANVIGLGAVTFKWNYQKGDKIGVAVEGVSFEATQSKDSSYKTMWALPKNDCPLKDLGTVQPTLTSGTTTSSSTTTQNAVAYVNVPAGLLIGDTSAVVDDGSGAPITLADWPEAGGYLKIDDELIHYSGRTGTSFTGLQRGLDGTAIVAHANNAVIYGDQIQSASSTTIDTYATTTKTTVNTTVTATNVRGDVTTTSLSPVITTDTSAGFDAKDGVANLNDCLERNLVSPAEGDTGGKIKLSLFYTPDAPMNDSTGINSDYLAVSAAAENVNNEDYLRYEWIVYKGSSPNPADWGSPLTKTELAESTQTSGIGVKTLKFKLVFPDPSPNSLYLKVMLKATEQINKDTSRGGTASIIVPLSSSKNKIYVYRTKVVATDLIGLDTNGQICRNLDDLSADPKEAERSVVCPVLKNEVLGLKFKHDEGEQINYLWTVNGEPLTYSTCFFEGCSGPDDSQANQQGDTAYIPILKDVGSTYTVNLSAVRQANGEKINVLRTFQVVNPSVKIVPDDPNANIKAILLGKYVPLEIPTAGEEALKDFSDTDFQTVPGAIVKLKAQLYPFDFAAPADKTAWLVDGQANGSTGKTTSFTANKLVNDAYSVTFNTLYTQDLAKKKLLNKYWEVQINQFYETQLSHIINIDVVQTLPGISTADINQSPPRKFLAAIFSGIPSYINFLFRIVLTSFLLLFGVWIILSFFQGSNKNEI